MWCILCFAAAFDAQPRYCRPSPFIKLLSYRHSDAHVRSFLGFLFVHTIRGPSILAFSFICVYSCPVVYVTFTHSFHCAKLRHAPLFLCLVTTHLPIFRSHKSLSFSISLSLSVYSCTYSNIENDTGTKRRNGMRLRMLYICNPINFHILWPMTKRITHWSTDMWSLSFHQFVRSLLFSVHFHTP